MLTNSMTPRVLVSGSVSSLHQFGPRSIHLSLFLLHTFLYTPRPEVYKFPGLYGTSKAFLESPIFSSWNGLNENIKVLGKVLTKSKDSCSYFSFTSGKAMPVYRYSSKIHKTISYLRWIILTSTCFFPTEIGNADPALQLTDTQLQRAHKAFNKMQISTA